MFTVRSGELLPLVSTPWAARSGSSGCSCTSASKCGSTCSGSGGKAAYLPTGYPFGDGADLVFLGTSHDCCARCSDDESGGMTSLYLQTMKLFASVFGSIAIAAVSMMPRAASGYEYGESCCEYNGKRLGDCHFYSSKNGEFILDEVLGELDNSNIYYNINR